jgi:hypothetical protein
MVASQSLDHGRLSTSEKSIQLNPNFESHCCHNDAWCTSLCLRRTSFWYWQISKTLCNMYPTTTHESMYLLQYIVLYMMFMEESILISTESVGHPFTSGRSSAIIIIQQSLNHNVEYGPDWSPNHYLLQWTLVSAIPKHESFKAMIDSRVQQEGSIAATTQLIC